MARPLSRIAARMFSTSPPGSTTTPCLEASSNRMVQFCWNGVTGMMPALSSPIAGLLVASVSWRLSPPLLHDLRNAESRMSSCRKDMRPRRRTKNVRKSVAILLDSRRAQARQAVLVDRGLPGQEFLHRQLVALAGFLEAEQPAANRRHHLRLAPDDPAPRVGWRKIRNG